MSAAALPERPDLDQLRRQAKELRDAVRGGAVDARARISAHAGDGDPLSLATAQLTIAREYGFSSWSALKAEIEARVSGGATLADEFLRVSLSAMTMTRAERLLGEYPWLATYDLRTAVLLGDADRVRRELDRDSSAATRPDEASGWPPLLGVCMSHWHRIDPRRAVGLTDVATLLLDAGADPDARVGGRPGEPDHCATLFAAAGCAGNPSITRLLIERGASVADQEHTVYLAAFHDHDEHECLRGLLAAGAELDDTALAAPLTTGDAEALRILLDAGADVRHDIPPEALGENHPGDTALHAAVERDCSVAFIERLLAYGASPNEVGRDGRTPYRMAVRSGRTDVAELLLRSNARDETTNVDRFLEACLDARREEAERLLAGDEDLRERLTAADHAAIVYAADHGNAPAVALMLDLGFPINIAGGGLGETPLHAAAAAGSAEVVGLLIAHGADITALDDTFGSAPLGWASVGSGMKLGHVPNPDWVATARVLIEAGASIADVSLGGDKAPSPEVAELLRS